MCFIEIDLISRHEQRHGPFADEDGLAGGAVFLEQGAEVCGGAGVEERDLGQGGFFETLVHEPLRGGFFVAGGAIDLSGKEESFDFLGL